MESCAGLLSFRGGFQLPTVISWRLANCCCYFVETSRRRLSFLGDFLDDCYYFLVAPRGTGGTGCLFESKHTFDHGSPFSMNPSLSLGGLKCPPTHQINFSPTYPWASTDIASVLPLVSLTPVAIFASIPPCCAVLHLSIHPQAMLIPTASLRIQSSTSVGPNAMNQVWSKCIALFFDLCCPCAALPRVEPSQNLHFTKTTQDSGGVITEQCSVQILR